VTTALAAGLTSTFFQGRREIDSCRAKRWREAE